jgi:excisionase family DNA binding protein
MPRRTVALARSTASQRTLVSALPESAVRQPSVQHPANGGAVAPASARPHLDDLPDWLSIDEARAVLNIGRSSIYELVRSGGVPSRKFGRLIRIPREALRWQTDAASSKEVAS